VPMTKSLLQNTRESLRERLIDIIETSDGVFDGDVKDDSSLIKSGKLDSLALLNVALFVESEIGVNLDLTSFDLAREWDSIAGILGFISRHSMRGNRFHVKAHACVTGAPTR
jgi:acyl carrier protein